MHNTWMSHMNYAVTLTNQNINSVLQQPTKNQAYKILIFSSAGWADSI